MKNEGHEEIFSRHGFVDVNMFRTACEADEIPSRDYASYDNCTGISGAGKPVPLSKMRCSNIFQRWKSLELGLLGRSVHRIN